MQNNIDLTNIFPNIYSIWRHLTINKQHPRNQQRVVHRVIWRIRGPRQQRPQQLLWWRWWCKSSRGMWSCLQSSTSSFSCSPAPHREQSIRVHDIVSSAIIVISTQNKLKTFQIHFSRKNIPTQLDVLQQKRMFAIGRLAGWLDRWMEGWCWVARKNLSCLPLGCCTDEWKLGSAAPPWTDVVVVDTGCGDGGGQ